MIEIACTNCAGACCRENTLVSLTLTELSAMIKAGNRFLTVAPPSEKDRDEVIYPVGHIKDDRPNVPIQWLLERGREYEPLPAGYGRYMLLNRCVFLQPTAEGWLGCSNYDERPDVCREFEVGSDKCLAMRQIHNIQSPQTDCATQPPF